MFSEARFCTGELQPKHQFEAGRSLHGETIELFSTREPSAGSAAEFSSWRLGALVLTHATSAGAPNRPWRHRPRSCRDHCCLVLARTVTAEGARRQDLTFRPLALPFEGRAKDSEVIALYLPRDRLSAAEQRFGDVHGFDVSRDFAPVLADYLDSLVRQMPLLSAEHAADLEMPTRALVCACIAPRPDHEEAARVPLGSVLVDRVRIVVRQNMASPDFGPERLARLLAMSRSKLYRLFENSGGVAYFINRERLREAHRRLSDERETLSIQAIGNEVGFVDHSTFSRAFRREFGYSPTEARERGFARPVAGGPEGPAEG